MQVVVTGKSKKISNTLLIAINAAFVFYYAIAGKNGFSGHSYALGTHTKRGNVLCSAARCGNPVKRGRSLP
jgi:hypothetical protein